MAKSQKPGKKPVDGSATVVGVESEGVGSVKFYLSDDRTFAVLATGGSSWQDNQRNRDELVTAVEQTLAQIAMPKPEG